MRTKLKIINQSGIANFDFIVQISDTWTASTDSLISYKIIYTTDSFTQITPSISFLLEAKKALLVRSISYSLEKYFSSQLWWDLALNDEKSLGCCTFVGASRLSLMAEDPKPLTYFWSIIVISCYTHKYLLLTICNLAVFHPSFLF